MKNILLCFSAQILDLLYQAVMVTSACYGVLDFYFMAD